MRDGRVVQVGTPAEIYGSPAERYVAEFLGESNLLEGRYGNGRIIHGDQNLRAPTSGHEGADVTLMMRPEDLTLLEGAASTPAECNGVRGSVRDVVYLGNSRRVEVQLTTGARVVARTSAEGATVVDRARGDVLCVWDPRRSVVFGADGRALTPVEAQSGATI